MNFQEANQYLESFVSYEKLNLKNFDKSKFNLDKLREALDFLSVDYSKLNFVHVAGSKGKGTVSKMIAEYLYAKEFKTGAFFSPHLLSVTERIWINGGSIYDQSFALMLSNLEPFLEAFGKERLSYFEVLFIAALKFFIEEKVDFVILEVGLGGRFDTTNIVLPKVSVLTKVEKEHTEILGETIEEILAEKLGIVKEGVPLVVGEQDANLDDLVRKMLPGKKDGFFVNSFDFPIQFEHFDKALIENAKTAYLALKVLFGKVDYSLFLEIFKSFKFLGRFDVRQINGRIVVFDNAHTVNSLGNLFVNLQTNFPGKKLVFLFSLMQGKELVGIFKVLHGNASRIVFTESNIERSFDSEFLLSEWGKIQGERAMALRDCNKAFEEVLENLQKDEILVVTGSNFLVGMIMERFVQENV